MSTDQHFNTNFKNKGKPRKSYEHLVNTDTSLLQTFCFIPGERKPLHILKTQPA